jgi:hypothetical protein
MLGLLLRRWMILTAEIVALPTCSLAQVDSRVDSLVRSRVESGVFSGFNHYQRRPEEHHYLRYPSSSCWRAIRHNGLLIV